jgi:large exoprotein involved in heme utilization and adhesion
VVAVTAALRARLAWVSSAPLGRPVVPEVYRITAVSSSRPPVTAGTGRLPSSSSANAAGSTATKPVPAASAPLAASSATPCQAKISEAPESPR